MNLDREKQVWSYDRSALWKDSTNASDSWPQRGVCNTSVYAPIYVVETVISAGLVVTDCSKRYRNNQTMTELML